MRLISFAIGAALLAAATTPALSAQPGGRLTPPKDGDWSSTLLKCAEGKKITAIFTGQDKLAVGTPEGEFKLSRVKGDDLRYRNDKAEFVVEKGQAQFTGAKNGPHRECKPG